MQPSTVLSVVARRQREAEGHRIATHEHACGGTCASTSAHASSPAGCQICPAARSAFDSSDAGGAAPTPTQLSPARAPGEKGLERGFICGHQMVAEASAAGWEGVCSGSGAGAEGDAAATGVVVSFCGHGMHMECLQRFLDTQRNFYGDHAAVLSEREFVCPLCRSLGNTLVPVSALSIPPTAEADSAAASTPRTSMINLSAFGPTDREGEEAVWGGAKAAAGTESSPPTQSLEVDADSDVGAWPERELSVMSVKKLKQIAAGRAVDLRNCLEKQDMVQAILLSQSHQQGENPSSTAAKLVSSGGGSPAAASGGKSAAGSNVRAAPGWWAKEPSKLAGFGAESEWVKALPQRGMGVAMATRLHDLMKAATSHQTCARADLGIKDSGTDLMTSAGTAICSAASALVYSIASLEMTWRLGGTGAATSEEAAAEARAQRELEDDGEVDLEMVDEDEFLGEGGVISSAAGAAIGGVGLVGRGAGGEGVTTVATNDLVPLMVLARSVRGLMHYPGNESWRWRAIKLWCRLISAGAADDVKKASPEGVGADQKKKRELAVESLLQVRSGVEILLCNNNVNSEVKLLLCNESVVGMNTHFSSTTLQADHAALLGHWVILATPLPVSTPGAPSPTPASSFSGSVCSGEREMLGLEFLDALQLLWLAHVAQLLLRATKTVAEAGRAWISEQGLNADALKRGNGVAVHNMFGQVWALLPVAEEIEDKLKDAVFELAIAAALPFLRRALLLRAVVLGAPLPTARVTASALEQSIYLLGVLRIPDQFRLDEQHKELLSKWLLLLPDGGGVGGGERAGDDIGDGLVLGEQGLRGRGYAGMSALALEGEGLWSGVNVKLERHAVIL